MTGVKVNEPRILSSCNATDSFAFVDRPNKCTYLFCYNPAAVICHACDYHFDARFMIDYNVSGNNK